MQAQFFERTLCDRFHLWVLSKEPFEKLIDALVQNWPETELTPFLKQVEEGITRILTEKTLTSQAAFGYLFLEHPYFKT